MVTENMVRSTTRWLLSMQKEAGTEQAMKCYDVMREVFGEDLASSVLFGILEKPTGKPYSIGIKWITPISLTEKINAIKAIRQLTGYGLADSKAAVEECVFKTTYHNILDNVSDETFMDLTRELKRCGLDVS